MPSKPLFLRRALIAYRSELLICGGLTLFLLVVSMMTSDWDALKASTLIWILHGAYIALFQLPYRISWDEAGVTMFASGGKARHILFSDIATVTYEAGSVSQSRPFRRIVICPIGGCQKRFIDVSLRHFKLNDIYALLDEIHVRRPNLPLPEIPELRNASERDFAQPLHPTR